MTGILQGFICRERVDWVNQSRNPWPEWPRRVGARTRPGRTNRMSTYTPRQHKFGDARSCKAASQSCKADPDPPARIRANRRTAATPSMYHLAALTYLASRRYTETGILTAYDHGFSDSSSPTCKACSNHHTSHLQGGAARIACKDNAVA